MCFANFPDRFLAAVKFPLISTQHSISIGKYLVSPLSRRLDDGGFQSGVSIRSGRGSASTDRVMRFSGSFATEGDAHQYAHEQGRIWVSQSGRAAGANHA